jgi:hypothetical protein
LLKGIEGTYNLDEIVEILEKTPLHVRLKDTGKALVMFQERMNGSDYKISWFLNCIKPALTLAKGINYVGFE